MRNVDWVHVAILVIVVVPSIILHEVAHGAVANLLGDDTAKRAGRLTLNPVAHVDPFGTVILPGLLALSGLGAFGYAKPVPVTPSRLRDPRRHSLLVSLAGPGTNIVLAVGSALALRVLYSESFGGQRYYDDDLAVEVLLTLGLVNVLLAAFNLLPIPPLDGSALIERFLPTGWWPFWHKLRQWGMGVLLLLLLAVPGLLDRVLQPAQELWLRLL